MRDRRHITAADEVAAGVTIADHHTESPYYDTADLRPNYVRHLHATAIAGGPEPT